MEIKEIYEKFQKVRKRDNEIIIYGAGLVAHLIYSGLINKREG